MVFPLLDIPADLVGKVDAVLIEAVTAASIASAHAVSREGGISTTSTSRSHARSRRQGDVRGRQPQARAVDVELELAIRRLKW